MNKIKILNVVITLKTGGIETWLLNVCRNIDKKAFQIDFLTISNVEGVYEHEFKSLGCKVVRFTTEEQKKYTQFFNTYRDLVREGEYDIVHLHRYLKNGYFTLINKSLNVTTITHSHTNRYSLQVKKSLKEQILRFIDNSLSDYRLGCSIEALKSAYYRKANSDVIYYGIEANKFKPINEKFATITSIDGDEVSLQNKKVIGHIGRFVDVKNHHFIIEIARKFRDNNLHNFHFILVGDGPLLHEVKERIVRENLQDIITLTGSRQDVYKFFISLFDYFILPSKFEGLGIVLLEAQCAGIPIFINETITEEVNIVEGLITRLSITDAGSWCNSIVTTPVQNHNDKKISHEKFIESIFNIQNSVSKLELFYKNITK